MRKYNSFYLIRHTYLLTYQLYQKKYTKGNNLILQTYKIFANKKFQQIPKISIEKPKKLFKLTKDIFVQ